jgi:hypothetical protein
MTSRPGTNFLSIVLGPFSFLEIKKDWAVSWSQWSVPRIWTTYNRTLYSTTKMTYINSLFLFF